MKPGLTLRPLRPEETPALARLHAMSFADPWSAEDLLSSCESPGVYGLVLEQDGKVVGFVLARATADEAEILTVAVDPAVRRSGFGRALVEAAAELAKGAGARALFLEVAIDNEAGLGLYKALEFIEAGFRPRYYRRTDGHNVDARVLRRDLTV
jgi:ribosomal-protein-alanine N-acetyltransferase